MKFSLRFGGSKASSGFVEPKGLGSEGSFRLPPGAGFFGFGLPEEGLPPKGFGRPSKRPFS